MSKLGTRSLLLIIALALISGICVAVHKFSNVLEAVRVPASALFDHGLSPVKIDAPSQWTNQWCGSCHKDEYQQWSESRHAMSGLSENFESQVLNPEGGRRQWCLNCHAPLNPGGDRFATAPPAELDEAFEEQHEWLTHGVDCLTCHVRDGHILGTHVTQKAKQAHAMRAAPELASAEFCAGCHQFGFKNGLPDTIHGELQQASLAEFLDFRRSGGDETRCHDCHMPAGDHRMPGGYSDEMIRLAVNVNVQLERSDDPAGITLAVDVSADNIGHRMPGGEHFRYLTLHSTLTDANGRQVRSTIDAQSIQPPAVEAGQPDSEKEPVDGDAKPVVRTVSNWPQIETFRRFIGEEADAARFPDTRLWPGETRRFRYFIPLEPLRQYEEFAGRVELWYHFMDNDKARTHGFLPKDVAHPVLTEKTRLQSQQRKVEQTSNGTSVSPSVTP